MIDVMADDHALVKRRLFDRAYDWFAWPHEVWHVLAAYLVGVPQEAFAYTPRRFRVLRRIPVWKFVVVALAPLAAWFTIGCVAGWGWWRLSGQPTAPADVAQLFVVDVIVGIARVVLPRDLMQHWSGSLATSALAWLTAIASFYWPTCGRDVLSVFSVIGQRVLRVVRG